MGAQPVGLSADGLTENTNTLKDNEEEQVTGTYGNSRDAIIVELAVQGLQHSAA